MKMKTIRIIALILALVLTAGGITAYQLLPHSLNYDIDSIKYIGSGVEVLRENEDEVIIKESGEDFKVLMFTDIHLDGNNKTSNVTLTNLVNNIEREKPDLVIVGGDTVTNAFNRKRTKQFAEIFEKMGVYWAGILGNHEGDNTFSIKRDEMVDIFSSYDHCLMRKGPADVWGNCNYALVILNEDHSVKHTFFFMDTGDEMTVEQKKEYNLDVKEDYYDGVKESQVKWYTAENERLKQQFDSIDSEDFTSTVVVHIPLPQYEAAAADGKFLYGEKLENICESGFDAGLFDAIKAGGTTKSVFCGHDHLNTFGVEYEDILLSYIQPSGYGSYTAEKLGYEEKDWLQGYTRLNLHKDGTFTQDKFRNAQINAE